jgi:hypothetical protein
MPRIRASNVGPAAQTAPPGTHVKMRAAPHKKTPMDIERINAIGTLLADLTARTEALRGYL